MTLYHCTPGVMNEGQRRCITASQNTVKYNQLTKQNSNVDRSEAITKLLQFEHCEL